VKLDGRQSRSFSPSHFYSHLGILAGYPEVHLNCAPIPGSVLVLYGLQWGTTFQLAFLTLLHLQTQPFPKCGVISTVHQQQVGMCPKCNFSGFTQTFESEALGEAQSPVFYKPHPQYPAIQETYPSIDE
jgi:hypothetical protein